MTLTFRQEPRFRLLPTLALGVMAASGALSISAMLKSAPPKSEPFIPAPSADFGRWTPRGDNAVFKLDIPDFARSAPVYSAEILQPAGTLRDIIAVGDDKRFIRLTVQRHLQGTPSDFYLEITRRSADAGLALIKSGQPQLTASRFGKLEIADVSLTGPQGPTACAGLRLAGHAPEFLVSGLICGIGPSLDSQKIACLIDQLELKDIGEPGLIDIFTDMDAVSACKTPRIKSAQFSVASPPAPPPVRSAKAKKR